MNRKMLFALLLAVTMLCGCRQEQKNTTTQFTADPTSSATTPTQEGNLLGQEPNTPTTEASASTEETTTSTQGGDLLGQETNTPTTEPNNSTGETTSPTEGQNPQKKDPEPPKPTEDSPALPPEELPPVVEIPPQKDPVSGEVLGVAFPCEIAGYGLVIEKLAPYSGMFVEDGTNASVQNVAMLMVKNKGDFPLEYTSIRIAFGQEELLFDVTALPVGETLVVQEKTGKAIPAGTADSATALVVQRADMEMSDRQVRVTDNGDNTLTVENLTDKTIPTVRVFYKYYMEEEGIFVGGIAFTVRITRLGAGAKVRLQPSHYTSQTSRVVMVLTYDSEV